MELSRKERLIRECHDGIGYANQQMARARNGTCSHEITGCTWCLSAAQDNLKFWNERIPIYQACNFPD